MIAQSFNEISLNSPKMDFSSPSIFHSDPMQAVFIFPRVE